MTHPLIDFLIALPFVVSFAVIVAAAIWHWTTHAEQRTRKKGRTPTARVP